MGCGSGNPHGGSPHRVCHTWPGLGSAGDLPALHCLGSWPLTNTFLARYSGGKPTRMGGPIEQEPIATATSMPSVSRPGAGTQEAPKKCLCEDCKSV